MARQAFRLLQQCPTGILLRCNRFAFAGLLQILSARLSRLTMCFFVNACSNDSHTRTVQLEPIVEGGERSKVPIGKRL